MSVDLGSRAAKLREWALQLRMREMVMRATFTDLNREFRTLASAAGEAHLAGDVTVATEDHGAVIERILLRAYGQTGELFGERSVEETTKMLTSIEQKDAESIFDERFRRWAASNAAAKVTQIADTTRKQISRIIESVEGSSVDDVARAITNRISSIGRARAAVIARTEIHTASNAANTMGANATDVVRRKEWIAASDGRTRESHAIANGQVVERDEKFQVGAANLAFPGDPEGPAMETVQCRCVLGWQT